MMNLPETLYLDLTTWRCGGLARNFDLKQNYLGKGKTQLKNKEGFSCCLGQWISQTRPGIEINGRCRPDQIDQLNIKELSSYFNLRCMEINDHEETTIETKIELLRKEVEKIGRKLIVKDKI